MNDTSADLSIRKVLDRLSSIGVDPRKVCEAFATLVFLRWADYRESQIASEWEFKLEKLKYSHWRQWVDTTEPSMLERWLAKLSYDLVILSVSTDMSVPSDLKFLSYQLNCISSNVVELSRINPKALAFLVDWIANQPIRTPRDFLYLRSCVDFLLEESSDRVRFGSSTPRQIAGLMAEIAAPMAGESIYDPCFGNARLLTAALDAFRNTKPPQEEIGETLSIVGTEANSGTYVVGLTRLVLSGASQPSLLIGNSLDSQSQIPKLSGPYDIVLVTPPWGMKIDLGEGNSDFQIRTKDSSCLYVQHALSLLKIGGRAVIALPQAFLNRRGTERELRRLLVEQNTLESVVSLPRGAFAPYSSIATCILKVRRGGHTSSVRMADAKQVIHSSKKLATEREQKDNQKTVVSSFIRSLKSTESMSDFWNTDASSLAKIDYDLSVARRDYSSLADVLGLLPSETEVVKLRECCEIIAGKNFRKNDLIASSAESYCTLQTASFLLQMSQQELIDARSRGEIFGYRDGSTFKFKEEEIHRFALEKGIFLPSPDPDDSSDLIPYIRLGDVHGSTVARSSASIGKDSQVSIDAESRLCDGDLLISKSGSIGKVALVRNQAVGAVASGAFYVLRISKNRIDPSYLLAYLESQSVKAWLDDRSQGASAKNLSLSSLEELPIAIPSLQIQSRIVQERPAYGNDTVAALSRFLSDGHSNEIEVELNRWIESINHAVSQIGETTLGGAVETLLHALEKLAEFRCPINTCCKCLQPYFLDFESLHLCQPDDWGKGIDEYCLSCWLGLDSNADEFETPKIVSSFTDWALQLRHAIYLLNRISEIEDQISVFTILREIGSHLIAAEQMLAENTKDANRALRLTRGFRDVIDSLAEKLSNQVDLVVEVCEAVELEAGEMKIDASIYNRGGLPIRNLVLSLEPGMPTGHLSKISYLAPQAKAMVSFVGSLQHPEIGAMEFSLNWTGVNLLGLKFSNTRQLAIELRKLPINIEANAFPDLDLGGSPYICGTPVKPSRNDVFFGREDLIKQISRQITESGNVVLLQGNRRAGKSSILWHLEGRDSVPGWLGVICDLQSIEGSKIGGVSTAEVFRGIAYEIVRSVRALTGSAILPDGTSLDPEKKMGIKRKIRDGIGETDPFGDFREYLELVLETLESQGVGLLLMIDEFDKLQEGIDNGITSPQVPENIRFLIQTYPRFSAIITGSRRLKRMREEYFSMLFGLGTKLDVSSLSPEAAARLVTEPVRGKLNYSTEAVDLCCTLTDRQPYLLQCLCNRIFDLAAQRKISSINLDHVRDASRALTEDNEHFATLWDYAEFDRRRFLLALICREESEPDHLRVGVIQSKLDEEGIEIPEETLISDLEFLYQLEILAFKDKLSGAPTYTLAVPMMRDWISSQPEAEFDALRMRARREVAEYGGSEDLNT